MNAEYTNPQTGSRYAKRRPGTISAGPAGLRLDTEDGRFIPIFPEDPLALALDMIMRTPIKDLEDFISEAEGERKARLKLLAHLIEDRSS